MKRTMQILFLTVLSAVTADNALGGVIYVETDTPGPVHDGTTWGTAYDNLQDALDDPNLAYGDEIWVAAGTYYPSKLIDPCDARTASFQIGTGVGIYGGFEGAGSATHPGGETQRDQRDPNVIITILSGDLDGNDVPVNDPCDLLTEITRSENSYHVVAANDVDANAILDGFTITAGNASRFDPCGIYDDNRGAGMVITNANPTLNRCIFTGNSATDGGGMFNYKSNPRIDNCSFTGNIATNEGGGIYNQKSSPSISNCSFTRDVAINRGGGMHNYRLSSPILMNCVFFDNHSENGGGLVNAATSSPILADCTFEKNAAGSNGGGMYSTRGCHPQLTGCIFNNNSADDNGGGMHNVTSSNAIVTDCEFSNNDAEVGGGGMANWGDSNAVVNSCIFINNSAVAGGGMQNTDSDVLVTNCSLISNSASAVQSGGIFGDGGTTTVTNCILWQNSDPCGIGEAAQIAGSATFLINYNCIQGWTGVSGGTGNIGSDPCFADADGPDDTAGTEDDDLRLKSGSPCIDAGNNAAVPEEITTDLDGNPRFYNDPCSIDTGNGTPPIVDMGPYEGPPLVFLIDGDPVTVFEGNPPGALLGTKTLGTLQEGNYGVFLVALSRDPNGMVGLSRDAEGRVEATVARYDGDNDIIIIFGSTLLFDPCNYGTYQPIVLAGLEDDDYINGIANIRITADGIVPEDVTAVEADNEPVPAIVYVDDDANGLNDGTSWPNAFNELQYALYAADNTDGGIHEVWAAAGTYKPDYDVLADAHVGDREGRFELINGVALYGGFAGSEDPAAFDLENRNFNANESILSGDLLGNDREVPDPCNLLDDPCRAENSYHVVFSNNCDETTVLDGFTIVGGNANHADFPDRDGGGMLNIYGSSPIINNCTFRGNSATGGGGMFNIYQSCPTIVHCAFSNNAGLAGGGMYNTGSSGPILFDCIFSGNWAQNIGAGMCNFFESDPNITSCTFTGNSANGYGGGGILNAYDSNTMLIDCTFSANMASNGGGMCNYDSDATLANCTFTGNSADSGGGLYDESSSSLLRRCAFAANLSDWGGGMFNSMSSPLIQDCVFSGNTANITGGGLLSHSGSQVLTNCTFHANSATSGDGLAFYDDQQIHASDFQATNCIFYDGIDVIWNDNDSDVVITYCDVQGGWPGAGNIDIDPCFVNAAGGDYHLRLDSVCIDAGDPCGVEAEVDMDGYARVVDGDGDEQAIVDMGADEVGLVNAWRSATQCYGDGDGDGDVDTEDWPAFRDAFGRAYPDASYDVRGDLDRDGDVDTEDWPSFRDNFGWSVPADCGYDGVWPPVD